MIASTKKNAAPDRDANRSQLAQSLSDTLLALHRQRKKSLAVFGILMVLVVLYLAWGPRSYESEAKLLIRIGRESVSLDPTATTGQTVQVQVTRTLEINSILNLLEGRGIAEKVVEKLSPQFILERRQSNPLLDTLRWCTDGIANIASMIGSSIEDDKKRQKHENAIKSLQGMLDIYAVRDSNVINVSCQANSPEAAQKISATLLDVYRKEHATFNRTHGSEEFFASQSQAIQRELEDNLEKLRILKNKSSIVSIDNRLELLESKKMQIEMERLNITRQMSSSRGRLESLQNNIETLDERILANEEKGFPNEAADQMRSQLYDLEMRERKLSARYGNEHPLLMETREQISDVRKIQEKEKGTRSRSKYEINPNWQRIQLDMLLTNADLAAYIKTDESLDLQNSSILSEASQLNQTALQIDKLERQIELQKNNYRKYRENLEQARIDTALEAERITNVNIVQKPTYSVKAVRPNKIIVLGGGLIMALFSSVAVALYFESNNSRIHSAEDIESLLSIPVLISIPNSSKQSVRV